MKAKIYSLLTVLLLAFTFSSSVSAATTAPDNPAKTYTDEEITIRMNEMRERVKEIKELDKSELSKQGRKELKKELREMNKEARALGQGGVYLSVGAIIIIILLLILIL
ncbi:hypothetical protein [Albibacterium bauzanense]|uniref:Seryl-tRNA synthetase n=1 Tax=Albibacterium bauzanense TaxID=653929 RepID=A0A4R1LTQ4_9SPHI|nr:hypothetical protein [Albibacterium bauzanense]TCK82706.1 hypothetical protein C8N28_1291 [Albibacterium bauzanense]